MTDSNLHIRSFEAADQEAVRRLIVAGLGEHFGFIDETLNPDLDDIMTRYIIPGNIFMVVQHDQEVVGTGALIAVRGKIARIVRVSVASIHRRLGIGTMIVEHLLAIARQHGYTHILVETNNDWEDAIGLYQRLGFRVYRRGNQSVRMSLQLHPRPETTSTPLHPP